MFEAAIFAKWDPGLHLDEGSGEESYRKETGKVCMDRVCCSSDQATKNGLFTVELQVDDQLVRDSVVSQHYVQR